VTLSVHTQAGPVTVLARALSQNCPFEAKSENRVLENQ
jgi:hypothetical protein